MPPFEKIRTHLTTQLSEPVTLVINRSETQKGQTLLDFANRICKENERITITQIKNANASPAIEIVGAKGRGVFYHDLPQGKALSPFIDSILSASDAQKETSFDPTALASLIGIEKTITIDTYMTPACVHCKAVVALLNKLALRFNQISSHVHDANANMEKAQSLGIRSTPTIFINGETRWVGEATFEDLCSIVQPSVSSWLSTLKSTLMNGSLEETLQAVLKEKAAAQALPGLLEEPEFTLHLSALRILEDVVQKDKETACLMMKPLCELLHKEAAQVRGDAAYALMLLGEPEAIPALKACENDPDEDVKEAVIEAIETLQALSHQSETNE